MSKYMIEASYSPEGIKGVMAQGGTARVDAIRTGRVGAGRGDLDRPVGQEAMATWSSRCGRQVAGVAGAERPPAEARRRRRGTAASAITPMPIRAQVGRPDGVTNASMTPLTQQHQHQPERDRGRAATLVRQRLRAGAAARGRPTTRTAAAPPRRRRRPRSAPACRAAGSARRTASPRSCWIISAPITATLRMLLNSRPDHRQAEHAEGDAQRRHPGVVGPHLGGEVRGGVLAVVAARSPRSTSRSASAGRDQRRLARPGAAAARPSSPRPPRR